MKKLLAIFLALTLALSLAVAASAATIQDNGWWDDDGKYDGWTLNEDGSMTLIQGNGNGHCDNRIGHGISDPENFEITVTVDSETNSRPIIKMFNLIIELNAENGNGNQFFVKNMDANGNWNNFDWLNATDCIVYVTLARENGGNLKVTVAGKDNATPITMDLPLGDPSANNLELAMYDCGNHPQYGIATFSVDFNEAEPPAEDPTPSTGDIFGVVVTLMAVSGTALVAMKKR